ncbi:thermonuclease family protein [Albimonas pacifica]|uniref:Endonuclease YncB, thermonuclease family n=1 Tax=Albimonas pacifica TaxID=1114924 RepID=A0A1I3GZ90_9RHOB|nr:thermonuclease family protein [Albimonas pacifica]SFI28835.1 Endonuclease YncB, thermonuclease family [Albimonas pacifica]
MSCRRRLAASLCAALAVASAAFAGDPGRIAGPAEVTDGDTLRIAGQRIRLLEIDAPERAQTCLDAAGAPWPCGEASTQALAELIDGAKVSCAWEEIDRYDRPLARCEARGRDLGRAMIAAGQAVIYRGRPELYGDVEAQAKAAKLGMWSGDFDTPWAFRRNGPSPKIARTGAALDAALEAEKGPGSPCPIKGNVSGNGRIYHMPGQADYLRTKIDESKGERWFCTEPEARDAGWRPAAR